MSKLTKAQVSACFNFQRHAIEFLESVGAVLVEQTVDPIDKRLTWYEFTLETIVGRLDIYLAEDHINTRFVNHDDAKRHVSGVNPYSGKWNFSQTMYDYELMASADPIQHFRPQVMKIVPRREPCEIEALYSDTGSPVG